MLSPIILAVDTKEFDTARAWIDSTRNDVDIYKLGLEFFLTFGAQGVESIKREFEVDIFLDLKLHDIPNTVASAARAISAINPRFLTVHASGGSAMIRAAVDACPHIDITAVTILTSLSEEDLFQVGFAQSAMESVVSLATLAVQSGAKAIVSSPLEIEAIRSSVGSAPIIITPGVRPSDSSAADDQVRTMTPRQAISAGANFLVIGRPITGAWSLGGSAMAERAHIIRQEIAR